MSYFVCWCDNNEMEKVANIYWQPLWKRHGTWGGISFIPPNNLAPLVPTRTMNGQWRIESIGYLPKVTQVHRYNALRVKTNQKTLIWVWSMLTPNSMFFPLYCMSFRFLRGKAQSPRIPQLISMNPGMQPRVLPPLHTNYGYVCLKQCHKLFWPTKLLF